MTAKHLLVTLAACCLTVPAADAAGARNKIRKHGTPNPAAQLIKTIKRCDANKDRQVTKDEFTAKAKKPARAAKVFNRLDRNHDDKLTRADLPGHGKKHAKKHSKKRNGRNQRA